MTYVVDKTKPISDVPTEHLSNVVQKGVGTRFIYQGDTYVLVVNNWEYDPAYSVVANSDNELELLISVVEDWDDSVVVLPPVDVQIVLTDKGKK